MIHRDLKPSNIIAGWPHSAASTAGSGVLLPDAKILDFGLARQPKISVAIAPLPRQTPPRHHLLNEERHRMTSKRLLTATFVVGMLNVAALAQPNDPLIGTWELNVAKSKGVKSGSTTIEPAGKGIKFTVDLVPADGTPTHWEFTANFDGKDYPVTGNSPYGNTVAVTRVDAKTIRIASKQDGKPTTTSTIVVSESGKTRTTTIKGTDVKGQPVNILSFYEKR